jgi:tellurite resistance protein
MPALDAKLLAGLEAPQLDALVEVMLLAASADGQLADAELKLLRQSLFEIDKQWLSRVDLDERIAAATKRIASAPRVVRLAELKKALPQATQRLAALELALRIVAADGVLRADEHDLVLEVAQVLEVDSKVAGDLIMRRLY